MRIARLRTALFALPGALGFLTGCKESDVQSDVQSGGAAELPRPDPDDRRAERERMVAEQLAPRGIHDERVLAALRRVPRHRFVSTDQAAHAYEDRPLPIGHGQTISQPFVVAFMTQALELDGTERVLEIGTGSGYQAAILGELAAEVWTIEIVEPLGVRARDVLAEHRNVHVKVGDGYQGWPEHAPFDAIMVTAAPDHVPQPLLDQLAVGGQMILPVGTRDQELIHVRRTAEGFVREKVLPVRFVPMTGSAGGK